MTLAFSVVIGAGIGYWLDGKYKTTWWTPVFALLGVIAGFREMFRAVAAANREDERQMREQRERAAETGDATAGREDAVMERETDDVD